MQKTLTIIFAFLISSEIVGRSSLDTSNNYIPFVYGKRLTGFVDSLRATIIADTAKFRKEDVSYTTNGRVNAKPYSKLFIVNNNYQYKLDIIDGSKVLEFVREILDTTIIVSITFVDSSQLSTHVGKNGRQGILFITTYDKSKFNPKVAGLTLQNRSRGDNFTKRNKGETFIRD